jgi:hypothetical protein
MNETTETNNNVESMVGTILVIVVGIIAAPYIINGLLSAAQLSIMAYNKLMHGDKERYLVESLDCKTGEVTRYYIWK